MDSAIEKKYNLLKEILGDIGCVAVAFSGGVDSSFLLAVAHDVLGDNAFAITADTALNPETQKFETEEFCAKRNIRLERIHIDVFENADVISNGPDRCYFCKLHMMHAMKTAAVAAGAVLVDGSNESDSLAYRPGTKALAELGVRSPLAEAHLRKDEIRVLSRCMNLPTWNTPSQACLASRIPYDTPITVDLLEKIDKAEGVLHAEGFGQVRVRMHGNVARIEVLPADMDAIMRQDVRERVYSAFRDIGIQYATLDLLGFRSGSTDEVLEDA